MDFETIRRSAMNTIGYAEAENKNSFIAGVSVGYNKAEKHYKEEIRLLQEQINGYKSANEIYISELKHIAKSLRIIENYNND